MSDLVENLKDWYSRVAAQLVKEMTTLSTPLSLFLLSIMTLTNQEQELIRNLGEEKKELLQDSVARLTCALPLTLIKSMTHDLDFKLGHSGGS